MPRKARITVPGVIHHIMARGLNGMALFRDDEDRNFFLAKFSDNLTRCDFRCYAWVLMSNHFHVLIRTSEQALAAFMRRLNSVYAAYYNRKYQRKGYLFQDRFKSIATQDQHYVEEIVRYIHLNPVRAGICKTLEELDRYQWCGHSALTGKTKREFQDTRAVLKRFGGDRNTARTKYRKFISDGIGREKTDDVIALVRNSNEGIIDSHQTGSWVIGDQEFVKKILRESQHHGIEMKKYQQQGWSLETLAARIGKELKISKDQIVRRSRGGMGACGRKALAWLGNRELGIPVVEIARFLGVSGPAVSMYLDEGRKIAEKFKVANLIS